MIEQRSRQVGLPLLLAMLLWHGPGSAEAQLPAGTQPAETESVGTQPAETEPVGTQPVETQPTDGMTLKQLLRAGGTIGLVILGLSMAMVALIVEHMLTIRRKSLMPDGLADSVSSLVATGRFSDAERLCRERHSFLGSVLAEGLAEAPLGYAAVEKSMEDASAEQSRSSTCRSSAPSPRCWDCWGPSGA